VRQDEAYVDVDVTSAFVEAQNGVANYGWAFIPTGEDGWRFASSEHTNAAFRPALILETYFADAPCMVLTQPQSTNVVEGRPFALSVVVDGSHLSYQWFKNNVPIPGATNYIYQVTQAALSDRGTYRIEATSACGSKCVSANATVGVLCAPNLRIDYELDGRVTLSWNACAGKLQYAESLGGSWSNVIGATNPTNFPAAGSQRFFRLQP